ncbi:MAG: hypothetical protein M0D55_18880 [Elusimicrobiota bacterium]|nr:MAG: hypothetical protein M0D55_18880 [Elusimicrobiota bacterium]
MRKSKLLIGLFTALIALCATLALVAWNAEHGWNTVTTILAAVVGGLISAVAQECHRREEAHSKEEDLLSALRIEVELNLKISNEGRDEKRRLYSTSAWDEFRPHVNRLKPDIAGLLKEGFGAAYMHRQALQVELIHANQGIALLDYSGILNSRFAGVMAIQKWKD